MFHLQPRNNLNKTATLATLIIGVSMKEGRECVMLLKSVSESMLFLSNSDPARTSPR